jgi:hypothetical protein
LYMPLVMMKMEQNLLEAAINGSADNWCVIWMTCSL